MIVYLQKIPLFGKFCFYGCYCFAEGPFRLLENAGNGQPVDPADNACRKHNRCHFCAKQDFDSKCDMTSTYKFEALEDEVTGERFINCCKYFLVCHKNGSSSLAQPIINNLVNPEGSCKRNICECDKQLAYGLRDAELNWNILHHARWGGFDKDNCLAYRNGRSATDRTEKISEKKMQCCGKFKCQLIVKTFDSKDLKPNPKPKYGSNLPRPTHTIPTPGSLWIQISVQNPKSKSRFFCVTFLINHIQVKILSDFHMLKMMVWETSNNAVETKPTTHSLLLAAKIK